VTEDIVEAIFLAERGGILGGNRDDSGAFLRKGFFGPSHAAGLVAKEESDEGIRFFRSEALPDAGLNIVLEENDGSAEAVEVKIHRRGEEVADDEVEVSGGVKLAKGPGEFLVAIAVEDEGEG